MPENKIVVAITGASGAIYAQSLLQQLAEIPTQYAEVAVVMSGNAQEVWQYELQNENYNNLPFKVYDKNNFFAPFASGSAGYNVMIVCPCSMGVLGRIASGVSNDLITRAADVVLKERRKLILVVRETPYNIIHLNNMVTVTQAGAIVCPATPSFYSLPTTLHEVASTVTHRILQLANLTVPNSYKWQEQTEEA